MSNESGIWLSICIPTHNRGDVLGDVLASIVLQRNEGVEVIILDSASTDNTKKIVEEYQIIHPNISYFYSDKKMGIDMDMSKVVDLATGKYCWLMSSDDAISSDAINILKYSLIAEDGVILCNRVVCDLDLHPIKEKTWLRRDITTSSYKLSCDENLQMYFESAIEFGAIFSYMSVLIFNREEWMRVGYSEEFTGSGYAHVFRVFKILKNGFSLRYLQESLVKNRSFNDSFMDMGVVKRFMLDINGYLKLSNMLFGDNGPLKASFLRVMTLEHPWYQLVKLRAHVSSRAEWGNIEKKLLQCGYSLLLVRLCFFIGTAKPIIKYFVRLRYSYNTSKLHRYLYKAKSLMLRTQNKS
jgi:abequosyltransferase